MKWLLAIGLAIWGGAANADYPDGGFAQAQTRFGPLQVVGELGRQRVQFNGVDLGIENHAYSIDGVWAVEGGAQDWAVLTSRHGGNMCGGASQIAVMLTATSAVRTDEFGICRGGPTDVRVTADALEVDISDPAPRVALQTFRFDGAQLTQTAVAEGVAPAAGAGQAVTRWLASHPQKLTEDPSEQARFAQILSPQDMDEMNRRMSGPGATKQEGGWVVARACQAHQCNASSAVWAIRVADGRPVAMFLDDVKSESGAPDSRTFGFADGDWQDPILRSLLEATLP